MKLLEATEVQIIKTKTFTLTLSRCSACEVDLTGDHTLSGSPDGIIDNWDIITQAPNQIVTLRLLRGGTQKAALQLNFLGQWKGRDLETNEVLQLTTMKSPESWRLLANPREWKKVQIREDNKKPEPIESSNFGLSAPSIDWTPYEYDLSKSLDKDTLVQSNTAVCLIAFDRPTYFERVVKSLAKNEIIKTMPVFLFIDRREEDNLDPKSDALPDTPDYISEQSALARKYLPQTIVISRSRNYGCGRNIIDARVQLFSTMKYDRVFVFEDDMIVSPDYLQLTVNMLDWAEKSYDNVGAVQAWNKSHLGRAAKDLIHGETHVTFTNWWGYLQTRESWEAMESDILEYQKTFLSCTYKSRQHRAIAASFKGQRAQSVAPSSGTDTYLLDETSKTIADKYHNAPPTGQDAATMTYFEMAGYVRLATTVNRGLYIGQEGIHMTPSMFNQHGMHLVELYALSGDKDRTTFWRRGDRVLTKDIEESATDPNLKFMGYIDNA